jgi:hypothetical protein
MVSGKQPIPKKLQKLVIITMTVAADLNTKNLFYPLGIEIILKDATNALLSQSRDSEQEQTESLKYGWGVVSPVSPAPAASSESWASLVPGCHLCLETR